MSLHARWAIVASVVGVGFAATLAWAWGAPPGDERWQWVAIAALAWIGVGVWWLGAADAAAATRARDEARARWLDDLFASLRDGVADLDDEDGDDDWDDDWDDDG